MRTGINWREIADYLEKIGNTFGVEYLEHEHRRVRSYYDPARAEVVRTVPAVVDAILPLLNAEKNKPYRVQTVAMRLLLRHCEYVKLLSEPIAQKADGHDEDAYWAFVKAFDLFGRHEVEIERYYDHHLARRSFEQAMFPKPVEKAKEEVG